MANIKKIEGKTGVSYKITVTQGRDSSGKQIRHFKTWKPDKPMTARQMEKAVQRVALDFEREIEMGYQMDNRQTFEQYARYVIELKERQGAANNSIAVYRRFMGKITPVIGHMKLSEIRPQHLNALYKQLENAGSRESLTMAISKIDLKELVVHQSGNMRKLGNESGVSYQTVRNACNHIPVKLENAEKIAQFLGGDYTDIFDTIHQEEALSPNTIRRIHSFLSVVFAQAEKEMLIPYNPCRKASPPAKAAHEPQYFQPDMIQKILKALEDEPIKYKTITHLLIVTGCRRGEIMGLKWSHISFESKQIKIDCSLSYLNGIGIYDGPTKTKTTRFIAIPDETIALLLEYQAWQSELRRKMGDLWNDTGYVFTRNNGEPIIPHHVTRWLGQFSQRHGLPHIHPHMFRHSAASIMIAEGVDIVTVSKMLGHANTSMTTDIYSHMIEESSRRATQCIADVMLRHKEK